MPVQLKYPSASDLAKAFVFYAVYVLCGKFGLSLAMLNSSVTAVWPPSGVAMAALLLLGRRFWWVVALGALSVNWLNSGTLLPSLGIAFGNTLEAFCGAWLVERFASGAGFLGKSRDMVVFALAAVISCALAASQGVLSLQAAGSLASGEGAVWVTWWLGDLAGVLLVVPLAILWGRDFRYSWERLRRPEFLLFLACMAAAGVIGFGEFGLRPRFHPVAFFFFPALLWPAFRMGKSETAAGTALISAFGVWGTLQGRGPFISATPNDSLLFLQTFMALSSVTSLAVAAVVAQNKADIEALHAAEKRLEKQAEDLAASNEELEQFSYAASHDLKEPLRGIENLVTWIGEGLGPSASPETLDYMARLRQRARRMGRLLDDLLEYSRVGKQEDGVSEVDLGKLAQEVAELLPPRPGIEIRIAPGLPRFAAAEPALRQVLINLVGNALKHHDKPAGKVEIEASKFGSSVEIRVKDDGPGIDPRFHERIFQVFQTLQSKDQVEGSGIGLALVKKIVERRGGSVRLESAPGQGSCFIVLWPKGS